MKSQKGPFPGVAFGKQMAANILPPLFDNISGELTASRVDGALGAARFPGRVQEVWLSVGASGKDDANQLCISGEVKINGTTCLTTPPSISHISGETSQQKTTKATGDTGIQQAVIDGAANSFVAGDMITYDLTIVRTATPTTEMANLVVCVELEPTAD